MDGKEQSDFIPLEDVVYAPLYALAQSNQQLRIQMIDAIENMGTVRQSGQDKVVHLDNISIAYDRVSPAGEDGCSVDNLQVQVPLLSIVPLTNLNVERAEIDFSAEVRAEKGREENCVITARICAPEQRKGDFLPRVRYKLNVRSLPATEGILRLTDLLNTDQIVKKIDATPLAIDGALSSDEHKTARKEIDLMKAKVRKLQKLHRKVSDMLQEQDDGMQTAQTSLKRGGMPKAGESSDSGKYAAARSAIEDRIRSYQEQILNKELELGLEKDYEG